MQSSFVAPNGAKFKSNLADLCTQTRGTWHLEPDAIQLTYRIRHRTVGDQGELQGIEETTVVVDIGIRDGILKVIAGAIPDISTT